MSSMRTAIARAVKSSPWGARVVRRVRARQLLASGREPELARCVEFAEPGTTVIDVGANVGNVAVLVADKVGRTGVVLALEPNADVYRDLVAGVRGTGVVPLGVGASDAAGWATFRVPVDASGRAIGTRGSLEAAVTRGSVREVEVRLVRLDDLVPAAPRVSLIKIDVEGHEFGVLRGAEDTLARHRPTLIVEIEERHLSSHSISDVVRWVVDRGYEAFCLKGEDLVPWADFDVERDQRPWAPYLDGATPTRPATPHVNNFLFRPRSAVQ